MNRFTRTWRAGVAFALSCVLVAGCTSYQQYAETRTARLREMYPKGISREEVQNKWGQTKPDFSAQRPDGGWHTYPSDFIANCLENEENATGNIIASVDRYWGADGLLSLCYCWYFYDSDGKIVDVEWQYKSD